MGSRRMLLVFFFSSLLQYGWGQVIKDVEEDSRPKPAPKQGGSVKPAKPKPLFAVVKFKTDLDCRLKLNGEQRGELLEGTEKIFSLKPDTYIIEATSIVSGHVFTDTIYTKANDELTVGIPIRAIIKKEQAALNSGPKVVPINQAVADDGTEAAKAVKEILANMMMIKQDSFMMGNDGGPADAMPAHMVKLHTFYLNKYEVTQRQWSLLMGANPSSNKCDACPVENITYDDATLFITKINSISSRKVRLPTEAEWEYAAQRGGMADDLKSSVWYAENARKNAQPVGKLAPNALGIYDLFGNVAEWCRDWYDPAYYKKSAVQNPFGPQDGREKVVRGGSFADGKKAFNSFSRQKQSWYGKSKAIGMRLALD